MQIGPHISKADVYLFQTCQLYLYQNRSYIKDGNVASIIQNFPKQPVFYNPKNKNIVIHTAYVNNLQSEKENVRHMSFVDLDNVIKICNALFKEQNVFINTHMTSKRTFDEERFKESEKKCNKNIKICFEFIASDDFWAFTKKFKNYHMCYDTAHIFASGVKIQDVIDSAPKPTLIHLNGNSTKFNSKKDYHTEMCGAEDQLWNKELLKEFLQFYKQIPMIIEARSDVYFMDDIELIKSLGFKIE